MNQPMELALIDTTIADLKTMIEESVKFQVQVSPVYQNIADKILGMLNRQEELDHWEVKDLLKLLELSNKAQLAPVEQLTKLVQSVTALYERSQLQDKVDQLSQIVNEINEKKNLAIEETKEETSAAPGTYKNVFDIEA
jgi:hypothetical protein